MTSYAKGTCNFPPCSEPIFRRHVWAGLGYHHGLEENLDFWLKRKQDEYVYIPTIEDLIFMQEC